MQSAGLKNLRRRNSQREIQRLRAEMQPPEIADARRYPAWISIGVVVLTTWLFLVGLFSIFSLSNYGIEMRDRDATAVVLTARSLTFTAAPTVAIVVGIVLAIFRLIGGARFISVGVGLVGAIVIMTYVARDLSGADRPPQGQQATVPEGKPAAGGDQAPGPVEVKK